MHTSVVSLSMAAETGPHGWTQHFDEKDLQLERKINFSLNLPHLKIPFSSSSNLHQHHQHFPQSFNIVENNNQNDHEVEETTANATTTPTLELFPLHSDENETSKKDNNNIMKMKITATMNNDSSSFSPRQMQYIEFLPLKNWRWGLSFCWKWGAGFCRRDSCAWS